MSNQQIASGIGLARTARRATPRSDWMHKRKDLASHLAQHRRDTDRLLKPAGSPAHHPGDHPRPRACPSLLLARACLAFPNTRQGLISAKRSCSCGGPYPAPWPVNTGNTVSRRQRVRMRAMPTPRRREAVPPRPRPSFSSASPCSASGSCGRPPLRTCRFGA